VVGAAFARSVAAAVRRHPRAIVAALAVCTAGLGAAAPFTRWDSDPELIALEGSPELRAYRDYLARFGSDELIAVAFERRDLLAPAGLAVVRSLTEALASLGGVERVASLDTAYRVAFGPFGPFASPLVPDELTAAPPPDVLLRQLRELPMTRDSVIDDTGRVTTLAVQPRARELGADARSLQRDVLDGTLAVLARPEYAGIDFHLAGSPVFNRELERLNARDAALFTPLVFGVVTALLAVALRGRGLIALAVAAVAATLAWVRGLMTALDVPQSTTTSLLPPLLMVLSVSVAIHVLARYRLERRAGRDPLGAVDATERAVLRPATLTAATTALGFGSLASSPIPSIRTFGLFAAAGVGVSLAIGAIGLPAALRVFRPGPGPAFADDGLDRFLAGAARFSCRRSGVVLAATAALCLAAAFAVPRVRVSTHDGDFFPSDHPLNRAYSFIESRLAGVTPLEVMLTSDQPGGIRDPRAIRLLGDVQDFLGAQAETIRGVSLADWIDQARDAIEPPAARALPLDAEGLERAAFVLEATSRDDLPFWVQDGWTTARISSRSIGLDSERNDRLLARLESFARTRLASEDGLHLTFTGLVPVFARMEQYLLQSQVRSFAIAFLCVLAAYWIELRSLRLACVAIVPNAVAIWLMLGAMGAAAIPLDVVTVMVASVNLGIIDDETIHVLHAVGTARSAGLAGEAAVARALAETGRDVVFTCIVLGLGFGVLLLSEFQPSAHFGGLTALTITIALAADLILLPALLRASGRLRAPAAHGLGAPLEEGA
jgi:predicted RND superfamily exporter protein